MTPSTWGSRQWLLTIAGLCLAGVAAALTGQYGFDMRPCPWCILQRILFIVIALACLVGAALPALARRLAAGLTIVLALLGSAAALYQHFVAAKSASCALTLADKIITALRLEQLLPSMFQITGSCAEGAVSVLHVPFELWSLGLFMVVALLALRAVTRRA
jgi:disulfide bond formation protein DsbB